jgi:uncharacterized SAM-binding protein YcdF (DUF218 family)
VRTLKALQALFLPSTGLLLGVAIALVCLIRRRHRAAGAVLALVLASAVLLGLPWVAGALVAPLERPFLSLDAPDQQPSAIVVLAGASNVYPTGKVDLNVASWRRLWRGIEVYHDYAGRVPLIYAGGAFNRRTGAPVESPVVAAVAVRAGVDPQQLVLEDGSTTTFESAQGIVRLWPERLRNAPRRIVLVTSAWHMRRSVAVFRKQGFDVHPIGTDFRGDVGSSWVPGLGALGLTELAWREWASVILYEWTGRT